MQSYKDERSAENFSENFQWNFSGMTGILPLFIQLRQYSASWEEKVYLKYSLLFVRINQCMPCFALITVILERNEETVMKDLIVIQNIDT